MPTLSITGPVERRAAAFDASSSQTAVLDSRGVVVDTNAGWRLFARMNGATESATGVGTHYLEICERGCGYDPYARAAAAGLRSVLTGERAEYRLEYPCHSPIGNRWFRMHAIAAPVDDGAGAVVHHVEVTARRLLEEHGVLDRSTCEERLATRPDTGGGRALHLLVVEVTGLAEVEDRLGSPAANDALAQLTNRARRFVRFDDLIYWMGPRRLAIVLADLDRSAAEAVGARLRRVLSPPTQVGALEVTVACSLGLGSAGPGADLDTLEHAAADALFDCGVKTLLGSPDAAPPISRSAEVRSEPADLDDTAADRPTGAPHQSTVSSAALRVLLVDASPGDASLISRELGDELTGEIRATTAGTLAQALRELDRDRVDCVLLDLGLPDATGFEALQSIRDAHPAVPIVVLSGHSDAEFARTAIRVGAQDSLPKSDLSSRELNRAIGFAIERSRSALSQRRLDAVLSRRSGAVLVVDPDGTLSFASRPIEEMLGIPEAEAVGRSLMSMVAEDDRPQLAEALASDSTEIARILVRYVHADGTHRWGETSLEDRTDDPAIGGTLVNVQDVTQRIEALEALRTGIASRNAVLAQSRDLAMYFDPDGTITWASPASRRLFGVEPEELVGLNGFDMIHPEDRERAESRIRDLHHVGDHASIEFRGIGPDGDMRWIEESVVNLVDDPLVGYFVANLRDITDRRSAEQASHFRESLLEAVDQPVVATDLEHRVTYWNSAAERLFGWHESEAVGRPVAELFGSLTTDAGDAAPQSDSAVRWSGEFWVRDKFGHVVAVEVSTSSVYEAGEEIGKVAVSTDLSDRLEAASTLTRLVSIVETSTDAIYSLDLDATITTWNHGAERMFGYEESQIVGRPVSVLLPDDLGDEVDQILAGLGSGQRVEFTNTRRVTRDGCEIAAWVTNSPLIGVDGQVLGCSVIARDITERVELMQQIEDDRRRLEEAQRSAHLGSFELDLRSGRIEVSDEVLRIFGVEGGRRTEPTEPVGGELPARRQDSDPRTEQVDFGSVHPEDEIRCRAALDAAIAGAPPDDVSYRIVRPDGQIRWVTSQLRTIEEPGRHIMSGTMLDVTELRTTQRELERLAYYDPLTGLPNRTHVTAQVAEMLRSATATDTLTLVGIVDLDRFKGINDRLGHSVGDDVLRSVAQRFTDHLGDQTLLGRFGGDEFVVARANCTAADAAEMGASFTEALDQPLHIEQSRFKLSASVGLVLVRPGLSVEEALRDADAAMYAAKSAGRSTTVLLDDRVRREVERRLSIEEALHSAIEDEQLSVVFQPIVEVQTGATRGFEALLRWDHPELGRVAPDEFVPLAEETGAILPIGDWVLQRSLEQAATWRSMHPDRAIWVAVNLSGRQVAQADVVERVAEALAGASLPPDALHLEVTEGVLVDTYQRGVKTLSALRELGISIKVDDFGTGYSSLSYLKKLPIDSLKIDRSFIDGLGSDPHDTTIVRTILSMASTLGLTAVAEGIETPHQLAALQALGCPEGQGYLWSAGLDPHEARRWLSRAAPPVR